MEDDASFATSADRFWGYVDLYIWDHGAIRGYWSHEHEVAPGVLRSNQPNPRRLEKLAARGVKSVLLLRNDSKRAPSRRLERETCARFGMTVHQVGIFGTRLTPADTLLTLLDTFRVIEKPFLMHCKSGIDRTGLASFLYLLAETDTPPEVAREQLSFKYLHVRHSRHGILDFMADAYLDAHRNTGMGIRSWIETEYDADAMTRRFKAG
ncbi:MAG: tyrosine-protein phosphatase [Silicimonas sp.]|nr:tyrosine-protein phosphatase [Silicimonas sp.]